MLAAAQASNLTESDHVRFQRGVGRDTSTRRHGLRPDTKTIYLGLDRAAAEDFSTIKPTPPPPMRTFSWLSS